MFKFIRIFTFSLSLLFPCITFGWYDTGHMIVAKIAEERLEQNTQQKADYLLSLLPDDNGFVEAACWADDFSNEIKPLVRFHIEPRVYDPENTLSEEEHSLIENLKGERALTSMLTECTKVLADESASDYAKAFALRWVIHLIGDIHQPLHCMSLYNAEFPEGDRYGTRFMTWLDSDGKEKKHLHFLWDGTGDERIMEWLVRPLSTEARNKVEALAQEITQMHPENHFLDLDTIDYSLWLNETYLVGTYVVYDGIQPESVPSAKYMKRMRQTSYHQLARAGYRLASVLNQTLGSEGSVVAQTPAR